RRHAHRWRGHRLPTLDEFAETFEDPDFCCQAELSELWEEQYGEISPVRPDKSAAETVRLRDTPANWCLKRKERVIQLQLEALKRQETLAASSPDDRTEAWLDAEAAKHLRAVGILRLGKRTRHAK
ncbi:MAG TPA: hypothetical protein VGE47_16735, partial [Burkholderiaceae bacterium]